MINFVAPLLAITAKQYLSGSSETLDSTPETDCIRQQGPNEHPKNKCCGIAPFYEKFNDKQSQCVGNEIQDL